jgi:hypothetical protein
MAGYRLPGPVCGEQQALVAARGTLAPGACRRGPVCVASSVFARAPLASMRRPTWSYLFRSCLNSGRGISDEAYAAVAAALGVDVATIKAVADVETSGDAFDALGRPRILFERHYFHRLTSGRFDLTHARVSAKSAGGYGKFSAQYGKLEEAYALDADAALRSASWGRFQIMGDNFIAAGFSSSHSFVKAMTQSEEAQLRAFVSFVLSRSAMAEACARRTGRRSRKAYNGPGYAKNQYDTKLAASYASFAAAAPAPGRRSRPPSRRRAGCDEKGFVCAVGTLLSSSMPGIGQAGRRSRRAAATGDDVLQCSAGKGRSINLCGPGDGRGAVPVRTQRNVIELAYPADAKEGARSLRYAHYFRAQTDRYEVRFENEGVEYVLFDYQEGKRREAASTSPVPTARRATSSAAVRSGASCRTARRPSAATPRARSTAGAAHERSSRRKPARRAGTARRG